jgi:hypothetical protein
MSARRLGFAGGAVLIALGAGLWWRFGDAVFLAGLGGWLC